jgi:hypothetical protein
VILTPKNWGSFQHYKDRAPAWIKLHKALLDDYEFACLPVASKALAPLLWLLASEYEGGKIDASLDKIAFRLHMTRGELSEALSPLLEKGLFDASEPLAGRKHDAILEIEIEIENIEKIEIEKEATASAAPDPAIPEREYFLRGREVLGNKSGALIANLLKAKGKNVALARAALEQASQKQNPTEFIAAICRGPPGKPLTQFQRDQHETKEILNELGHFARGGSGGSAQNLELLPDHSGERSKAIRSGSGEAIIDVPRSGYRASG